MKERESTPIGPQDGAPSWQQRPMSKGSVNGKVRPLSVLATENNASRSPRATPDPPSMGDTEISRTQIAQSLGSKDPAWFRQTADRGYGSAAYRKSEDSKHSEDVFSSGSMRLPGLTADSLARPKKDTSPMPESNVEASPSSGKSFRGADGLGMRYSSTASVTSTSSNGSPFPLTGSQRLDPSLAMPSYQGRMSPERGDRPTSPTKGLGGFVQSAMLKRSDSVNKRWSAQAIAGLSRGNSIASNRGGYDGARDLGGSMSPPRHTRVTASRSRDHSPASPSRPGSSHENLVVSENTRISTGNTTEAQSAVAVIKATIPEASSTDRQLLKEPGRPLLTDPHPLGPSLSPTKTVDTRRWSPTKASWLESAINKPDSPKPRAIAPQQPNWLAGHTKSKQLNGNADLGKSTSFKEITQVGLMKSPTVDSVNKLSSTSNPSSAVPTVSTPKRGSEAYSNSTKPESLRTPGKPEANPQSSLIVADNYPANHSTGRQDQPQVAAVLAPQPPEEKGSGSVLPSQLFLPPKGKTKPSTPPKKDFRSVLKPRHAPESVEKNDTPEFKEMFGKLKRTQTQNYVAPDELKHNILRGKAGLMTTGGPKKSEPRDEFKESILKKKDEMKAGGSGSTVRNVGSDMVDNAVQSLQQNASRTPLLKSKSADAATFVAASVKPKHSLLSPKNELLPKKGMTQNPGGQVGSAETKVSGDKKLAERFNPALAGLLSRGPPVANSSPVQNVAEPLTSLSLISSQERPSDTSQTASLVPLNHATKGRARGPKRRLPTSAVPNTNSFKEAATSPDESHIIPSSKVIEPEVSPTATARPQTSKPLSPITNNNHVISQPRPRGKPSTPKRPSLEGLQTVSQSNPTKPTSPEKPSTIIVKPQRQVSQDGSGSRTFSSNAIRLSPTVQTGGSAVDIDKAFASNPNPVGNDPALSSPVDGANQNVFQTKVIKLTKPPDANLPGRPEDTLPRGMRSDNYAGNKVVGLGILSIPPNSRPPHPVQTGLPSPIATPRSPPMPPKKPDSIVNRILSSGNIGSSVQQGSESPVPKTSEAVRLLTEFFDGAPTPNTKIELDAQSVFKSRQPLEDSGKIKTLRKQIWEVVGDGKKLDMPPQQEHILYHDKMYICTHVFGSITGTRTTEVYLWCGSGVSPSAVEDAQLFARRSAKDNGGKLIILHQGKETSAFFQALGGIVITRHSSSSTYMLCGRRHLGQIAFDEVMFTSSKLCSGFPYIISARYGKLYLWKGKGSGADELGCARLIGMDLGLTGEIEEVDDGREPKDFWDIFPNRSKAPPLAGGHWHVKPSCEKYATKLFSVDVESRSKSSTSFMWGRRGSPNASSEDMLTANVKEISPYAQSDLTRDGIFVLDTFFEIYMYVTITLHLNKIQPSFHY